MFTRAMFRTPDMEKQGSLLNKVAELIDAGKIRATHNETLRPINAANLRSVHAKLESGTAIGKITLADY
jgi:NADPH:quinone reductase